MGEYATSELIVLDLKTKKLTLALILSQIILVISSPSKSQIGWVTLILEANDLLAKADLFIWVETLESILYESSFKINI